MTTTSTFRRSCAEVPVVPEPDAALADAALADVVRCTVTLTPGVTAWFTGRGTQPDPPVGRAGNLSHRRPHQPTVLARQRAALAVSTATDDATWHTMAQVHGTEVAVVDAASMPGTEHRGVDALLTDLPDRPLVVQVADCVPLVLGAAKLVAVVHAGRRGALEGVVPAALAAMADLGAPPEQLQAVLGPAIGPCCYEVPATLRDAAERRAPGAAACTRWGTPAIDVPGVVEAALHRAGVPRIRRVGGCTACTPGWFSHRADPDAGRQVALVVRRATPGASR